MKIKEIKHYSTRQCVDCFIVLEIITTRKTQSKKSISERNKKRKTTRKSVVYFY